MEWRIGKSGTPFRAQREVCRGRPCSLVDFSWANKGENSRASAKVLASNPAQQSTSFRLAAGHFSLLAQGKVTRRNGLPRQGSMTGGQDGAIFRLAILARSENSGHPWLPPSGFADCPVPVITNKGRGGAAEDSGMASSGPHAARTWPCRFSVRVPTRPSSPAAPAPPPEYEVHPAGKFPRRSLGSAKELKSRTFRHPPPP